MNEHPKIRVSKLEAARMQLDCAIELWFADGDPVSIHTLACASHQIIHDVNKNRGGKDLLLDSVLIKDEYRKKTNDLSRKDMVFFKHADKDPDGITEFDSRSSEMFIAMSIHGLTNLGESRSDSEIAFLEWITIQHPKFLTESGRKRLNNIHVDKLKNIRALPKGEFFKAYLRAMADAGV
jgi:hypothetical protein